MQIGKEIQLIEQLVVGTRIDIIIEFLTGVVVISALSVKSSHVVFHPMHFTEVIVVEIVERLSKTEVEISVLVIQRGDSSSEITLQILATHDVSLRNFLSIKHKRFQTKTLQFLTVFIFLVIAKTIGIVQSGIEIPMLINALREQSLHMLLEIIINLVVVERLRRLDIPIRVVSAVRLQLVFRDTVPCVVGALFTSKSNQFEGGAIVDVTQLRKIRT